MKIDASGAYRAGKRFKTLASKLDKAEQLAATDLARRLVPEFARQATALYNLEAKRIRDTAGVRRASNVVELTGYDRPTGLLNFGAKASKSQGVIVTTLRANGATVLRHAFKAVGLSNNAQIFQRDRSRSTRVMTRGNYIGQRRRPIEAMCGSSTAQILRGKKLQEAMTNFAQRTLSAEIRRQLGRL